MDGDKWYGVRTVYEHTHRKIDGVRLFEERIVLVRAGTQDAALLKAEQEAARYASEGVEYVEYAVCFEMFDEPTDGAEVFSLMRTSRLKPEKYVDRFFDTGAERATTFSAG
jgi:hypothetical protein